MAGLLLAAACALGAFLLLDCCLDPLLERAFPKSEAAYQEALELAHRPEDGRGNAQRLCFHSIPPPLRLQKPHQYLSGLRPGDPVVRIKPSRDLLGGLSLAAPAAMAGRALEQCYAGRAFAGPRRRSPAVRPARNPASKSPPRPEPGGIPAANLPPETWPDYNLLSWLAEILPRRNL